MTAPELERQLAQHARLPRPAFADQERVQPALRGGEQPLELFLPTGEDGAIDVVVQERSSGQVHVSKLTVRSVSCHPASREGGREHSRRLHFGTGSAERLEGGM